MNCQQIYDYVVTMVKVAVTSSALHRESKNKTLNSLQIYHLIYW